jgi:hypothetical protein
MPVIIGGYCCTTVTERYCRMTMLTLLPMQILGNDIIVIPSHYVEHL